MKGATVPPVEETVPQAVATVRGLEPHVGGQNDPCKWVRDRFRDEILKHIYMDAYVYAYID